jgi:hypothetical protein
MRPTNLLSGEPAVRPSRRMIITRFAAVLTCGLLVSVTACSSDGDAESAQPDAAATTSASASPSTASPSTASPTAPPFVVPEGYAPRGGPEQGFTLAVPDTWTEVDPQDQDVAAALEENGIDPAVAAQISQQLNQVTASGQFFAAVDTEGSQGDTVPANVNVLAVNAGIGSLDALQQQLELGLTLLETATPPQIDRVDLPGGEAIRVRYTSEQQGVTLTTEQYAMLGPDGTATIVTLTTQRPADYAEQFQTIAGSLRPA